MKINHLSIEQVNLIKGIGILLIVFHNFFHNLPPILGQNEFTFNPSLFDNYIKQLIEFPGNFISLLFSVWGHYGVELFIFVSAYGTTIAYQKYSKTYFRFIAHQFSKIYISFLICLLLYISLGILKQQFVTEQVLLWDSILWKLLLISNFIPGEALLPVGPWWFIPFIFQLYFILPGIISLFRHYGGWILFAIAMLGYVLEVSFPAMHGFPNLNYSPLGHLPLICLGIYMTRKQSITIPIWLLLFSIVFFIASNYNFYLWIIADLSVMLILMALMSEFLLNANKHSKRVKLISFFGSISLHLFLVNGFLRAPFKYLAINLDSWWGNIIAALLSLAFSTIVALALRWLDYYLRIKLNKNSSLPSH